MAKVGVAKVGFYRSSSRRTGHSEFPSLHGRPRAHIGGEIESCGASSWADCIKMVRDRHPIVADVIMRGIDHHPALCFDAVRTCEHALVEAGLEIPSWREMSESPTAREAHPEPNGPKFGWQHRANMSLEEQRFAPHQAELSQPVKALWRSQRGPLAPVALTALPTSRATRIANHSAFGCVAVFAYPFLSPPATAEVATDLTSLATIEQLAPGWGCWGREVSRWSAPLHKCAERPGDAFPPMSSSAIWTLQRSMRWILAGWR